MQPMEDQILELLGQKINEAQEFRHLKKKKVTMVGVAAKEGQDHEGPELAPQALRDAQLIPVMKKEGWDVEDYNDLTDVTLDPVLRKFEGESSGKVTNGVANGHEETKENGSPGAKGQISHKPIKVKGGEILGKYCKALRNIARKGAQEGNFVLTLGGDHGIATGSILGLLEAYPELRVIWVDAHGDINTPETSPSGNYHGMPVAHTCGLFSNVEGFEWIIKTLPVDRICFIGLRDIDDGEKMIIKNNHVKYFSMYEVDRYGIGTVMEAALRYLDPKGANHPIHISFDIDSVDPVFSPGTGTLARGGLSYREAHYIMRRVCETGNLIGLDLVEINPKMDPEVKRPTLHGDDPLIKGSETVCLGVELIRSCLGHRLVL